MSREAMQQALEALEKVIEAFGPGLTLQQRAITALRQALETEQESVRLQCTTCGTVYADGLPPQVAQPEQEPVAWMHNFIEGGISIGKKPTDLNRHPDRWTALYKDPTPCKTCQALAMAVMNDQTYHEKIIPKREWVGLTGDEARKFYEKYTDREELIHAIDKFLEEKNGG